VPPLPPRIQQKLLSDHLAQMIWVQLHDFQQVDPISKRPKKNFMNQTPISRFLNFEP